MGIGLVVVFSALQWGCEESENTAAVRARAAELTGQSPTPDGDGSGNGAPPAGSNAGASSGSGGTVTGAPSTGGSSAGGSGGGDPASTAGGTSGTNGTGGTDPVSDEGWRSSKERFALSGSTGEVVFETRNMRSQSNRNKDGGWEYIFLTLRGSGFDRILLYQVGGGRNAVRYRVDGPQRAVNNSATSDNRPGVHRWRVAWDGSSVVFELDGRSLGRHAFSQEPTRVTIGGYDGPNRDFRGEWRLVHLD